MSKTSREPLAGAALMEALEAHVGRAEGPTGTCPYPVNEPMIHHWCDAIGDRNPAYLDPEAARRSGRDDVVAPPAMLQAWTMRGLRPPTPEEESFRASGGRSVLETLDEAGFTSVVATNCEQEYLRELVPGDQLTHEVTLEAVTAEKKTALGVGHFVTQVFTFKDQNGEVVANMRWRMLKFRPPSEESPA